MSARKAEVGGGASGLRGALGLVLAIALGVVVTGCESHKAAEKRKDDASDYNTALGIAYLRQGDVPLAKEKLDRALKENPSNPKVHSARAMLFDRMGQPSQAESEFQLALRLAPSDPDVSN